MAPECCVPAFLHAALLEFGFSAPYPEVLPSILGVHVRPGEDNPLGLPLETPRYPAGVRAADASDNISRLLRELELPLRFRHIPFLELLADCQEEGLDAALIGGSVVGLGVDYRILVGRESPRATQHVMRVISHKVNELKLIDDSDESSPATFSVDWERARQAVLAIADGLWLLGPEEVLRLPFTKPWCSDP